MKIELSKELTKKALEIGATHYDTTLHCFLRVSDDDVCYYSEGNLTGKWVGGLIKDDMYLEIDFDPPKSELLAEIEDISQNGAIEIPRNILTADDFYDWLHNE